MGLQMSNDRFVHFDPTKHDQDRPIYMWNKLAITVPELAKALGVGRNQAYTLCARSDFPAIRLGGKIVIPIEPLMKWINEQASHGGEI